MAIDSGHIRRAGRGHLGVLLIAAMLGYLVSSFCAGWLVVRLGVGPVLAWSSVLMVVNSWGYALASTWPVMAVCAVVALICGECGGPFVRDYPRREPARADG